MISMGRLTEPRAPIFNIVHGSFVDGYGIRTTIFLKGCPLRCAWCCNPEGQSFEPELRFIKEKCDGCSRCVDVCPYKAILINNGQAVINRNLCNGCGRCVSYCLTEALEIFGTWYTAEEIFPIIQRDQPFYESTNGGLTIGGGEASCWPGFVGALTELCHRHSIHVAIDTCGYTTSREGFDVLMGADLLLYDIKGIDSGTHRRNTGVSNQLILENLRRLDRANKPIIVRVPMIPGYNAEERQLTDVIDFLRGLKNLKRVDLLPFHEFGRVKYQQLGLNYQVHSHPIESKRQQEILDAFCRAGLQTQLGG